jgi:hypothetical protein
MDAVVEVRELKGIVYQNWKPPCEHRSSCCGKQGLNETVYQDRNMCMEAAVEVRRSLKGQCTKTAAILHMGMEAAV